MQISHAITNLEQQVAAHLRFADPAQAEMIGDLLGVLTPAIRQSMLDLVEAAATEVNSQLTGQQIEVRLIDGDPELVVRPVEVPSPPPPPKAPDHDEPDDEARITLRIPGYLKEIIAEAATGAGDSVNSWVVDALRSRTATSTKGSNRVNKTIQL